MPEVGLLGVKWNCLVSGLRSQKCPGIAWFQKWDSLVSEVGLIGVRSGKLGTLRLLLGVKSGIVWYQKWDCLVSEVGLLGVRGGIAWTQISEICPSRTTG